MDELFDKMKSLIADKLEIEADKVTLEASFFDVPNLFQRKRRNFF